MKHPLFLHVLLLWTIIGLVCACSDNEETVLPNAGEEPDTLACDFLPTNTAEQNAIALQRMLDEGGTITITRPGTYRICGTMLISSHTTLEFGSGVILSRDVDVHGEAAAYPFINRGAFTRTYDEDITIRGLHLECNRYGKGHDIERIPGLQGQIALFYVRNVTLEDLTILDTDPDCFNVHVCTFENLLIQNVHIEGDKDGIHLGRGKHFQILHGRFKTYDDPIALNAHDYCVSQPELGDIEDGLIEDCYDLANPAHGTVGYFARILSGAWSEWTEGNSYQIYGDAVVSEGRLYRTEASGPSYEQKISTCRPTHPQGTQTYADGLTWTMLQDNEVGYQAVVKRVTFRNIYLEKPRQCAFSIHFDGDDWSRSYYPNAAVPVDEDLTFEHVYDQPNLFSDKFISVSAPVQTIKVMNSSLYKPEINCQYWDVEGLTYPTTHILFSGNTFKGAGDMCLASTNIHRDCDIRVAGSVLTESSCNPFVANVTIVESDIPLASY